MIPKYRAWLKQYNVMVDDVSDLTFFEGNLKFIGRRTVGGVSFQYSVEEIELMQSTGLKDDLGEEIFEGDVILWTYCDEFEDSGKAKIIFDKGMFKLLDIRTEKEVWNSLFDCIENCNVYLQGNIYENPELLEVTE